MRASFHAMGCLSAVRDVASFDFEEPRLLALSFQIFISHKPYRIILIVLNYNMPIPGNSINTVRTI